VGNAHAVAVAYHPAARVVIAVVIIEMGDIDAPLHLHGLGVAVSGETRG
jgi:hypothetical protein